MYVHEPAAAKDPTRQDPVIRRDDDAIGMVVDNRSFDTFDAEIGNYWHI